MAWANVTAQKPCPVCGRGSWCTVSIDGDVACCRRVDAGGEHRIDSAGVDYWVHHLGPDVHGSTIPVPRSGPWPTSEPSGEPLADADTLNATYNALLELLTLSDAHRSHLLDRGFDPDWIEAAGYRTLPEKDRHLLADGLVDAIGAIPVGVPGVHHSTNGGRLVVGGRAGLMIPCRDIAGRIVAMKLRVDRPDDGTRYRYMSSRLSGGASPGAPIHVPLHAEDLDVGVVRLTEGELKADIAALRGGMLCISAPGVASWRRALDVMRELGPVTGVHLAYDADSAVNPHVARALSAATQGLMTAGFDAVIDTWPLADAKGIDDLLAGGTMPIPVPAAEWLIGIGEAPTLPGPPPPGTRAVIVEPTLPPGVFANTDDGNARRLVESFGDDLRYDRNRRGWVVWDGVRWAPDGAFEVERRARAVARAITSEANANTDPEQARLGRRWAHTSQSKARIDAMVALARSDDGIGVTTDGFDRDPWMLNCANGVVDLRTGELVASNRELLCSKMTPVTYHPGARSEVWDQFIASACKNNPELIGFLQRAAGYTLTGVTDEEIFLILFGPGGAGKSSVVEALKGALGDYSTTAAFDTFLERRHSGGPRNDIAQLAGSRMVTSSEVDETRKIASALVKNLTGSDTVNARFLYSEAFSFRPQFTLWLVANKAPKVPHDDSGLWRRILAVPFTHVPDTAERDLRLKAKLLAPDTQSAVLAWAVQGALDWQRDGLQVPEVVLNATTTYRESHDPLAGFIGSEAMLDVAGWVATADLMDTHAKWLVDHPNCEELSAKAMSTELTRRECVPVTKKRNGKTVRGWAGIRLLAD
jgi:putative DNA primase/helicase